MNKTLKKIIVLVLILFIGFNIYRFFSGPKKDPKSESNLVRDNQTQPQKTVNSDKFLNLLLGINTIKLSTEVFKTEEFRSLVDFSLKDEEQKLDVSFGRKNPFLPIGQDEGAPSLPSEGDTKVTTLAATEVTPVSASLNGKLETKDKVLDQYFEWGIVSSLPLGNSTASIPKDPLKDNFSYKLVNLLPETTYYYRAVSKTEQKIFTGEIMSFKTGKK